MTGFNNKQLVQHYLTFATGLVECLCFAGVVFGWASLVFVIREDGYFSYMCTNTTGVNGTQTLDCSAQDEQFALIFTIASFMNNFFTLPNGFLFDHLGTTVSRFVAIFIYTMGTLMVAFSSAAKAYLLFPALSLLGIGGMLLLITNMQVGNLFGAHRSTIITLYNGAFDSSSALFFIIKLLHESGISLRSAFLFLSGCCVIHILRTLFLLPILVIPYPLPDNYQYGLTWGETNTVRKRGVINQPAPPTAEEAPLNQDTSVGQKKTFLQCVLSRFFLLHTLWLSVMQLRHYLFIGTLNPMLHRLAGGESSLVSQYTNAFAISQMCGVLCAPWNGLIMDRHKKKRRAPGETEQEADLRASVLSLFLTPVQCLLFSVCASTPALPIQYFTFGLQVLNRSFLYGGTAAFLSVAFPSRHFGKLYGLTMTLSALVSLLQYPCFILVRGVLGGDPLYVNIFLTVLTLVTFSHPLSVCQHCKRVAAERARSRAAT